MNLLSKYFSLLARVALLLLVSTSTLFSQEIEWQNTIGGDNQDRLISIEPASDGGYFLGGYSQSNISGNKTEDSKGGYDFWLVKLDGSGVIQWQKVIGGSGWDMLTCMKLTNDDGIILGGTSNSGVSGDKTEPIRGNIDYWVVKLDSSGTIQWDKTIGGNNKDELLSIDLTYDGGYVLGGQSMSNISGDKLESYLGLNDYWVVKLDSTGGILWQNTIGGSGEDRLNALLATDDNGFILGGSSESIAGFDKTEGSMGFLDYWVVKLDSVGVIQWQNVIGGTQDDELFNLIQTSDGGYILGGQSKSGPVGDKTDFCRGNTDFWIVKISDVGSIQWQKTIGGIGHDLFSSFDKTDKNGYLLSGSSWSWFSGEKFENSQGSYDYWVLQLDSVCNIDWQNTIGGNGIDWNSVIRFSINNECIVGGYTGTGISGDKMDPCFGNEDYWVVKLTGDYNSIAGLIFADLNSNGIQDSGENLLYNQKMTEQNTGRFAFSEQNGNYSVSVLDTGNFIVYPQSVNWFSPVPSTNTASFTGILQIDSLNDFAFQPQGTFEDVCISITPMGNFRSGFTASYMINYGNYGNTTVSPTVYFYPYSNVTFQSATLPPNSVFPDSVVWNLPALSPFQTGSIIVTVNINLGLPIGTLINSSAHIEPYLTDDNPSCNNSNWEVYTTGSFDPNDILVNRSDFTTTELSASPWLEYIIRFQNTGNDTAFTVKILNPIDTNKLNVSTIEFVNASHPVNLNWINYQLNMEFKFENILLPDSNTNEPLSHGFVRYRIQPKTNLNAGDSITNFAAIYFDFNEPVITNTAKTIIVLPTGLASASPARGKLHVYPNPTENTLNISGIHLENGKAQLRLMDIYGKLILEKTITSITTTLETNQLSSGIYLIQSGELRGTFVKQ